MKNKAEAMVLASFAADSLALGVHWIYDAEQIAKMFGRVNDLLPPLPGSYHSSRQRGEFTHYGDQSFHLLQHLAESQGNFKQERYARDWQLVFNGYTGYMDRATRTTLKNMENGKAPKLCGSPSTDLGGPARIAPLLYTFRHNLEISLRAALDYTALTHTGSGMLDGTMFLARSCFFIFQGASPREAFEQALEFGISDVDLDLRLHKCLELKNRSVVQVVKEFGQMCSIHAALPGAVYAILCSPNDLEEALIETVMAGGDSAARGMVVGMVLGAYLGTDGIPERWLKSLINCQKIKTALDKLP